MVNEETQEFINDFVSEYVERLIERRKQIFLGTVQFEKFCQRDGDLANKLLETASRMYQGMRYSIPYGDR